MDQSKIVHQLRALFAELLLPDFLYIRLDGHSNLYAGKIQNSMVSFDTENIPLAHHDYNWHTI